ncbi:MAG: integrase core domain-containing protein [Pseudomonadota bacterium]
MDIENIVGEVEANGGRGDGKLLLQCGTTMRFGLRGGAAFPFNSGSRDEFLNVELFNDLRDANVLIERWRTPDTTVRPHTSPGSHPPTRETIIPADLASNMWKLRPDQPSTGSRAMLT